MSATQELKSEAATESNLPPQGGGILKVTPSSEFSVSLIDFFQIEKIVHFTLRLHTFETYFSTSFVIIFGMSISFQDGFLSIVVLGASGDLAKKKTFPALFKLYKQVPHHAIFHFLHNSMSC